MKNAPNFVLDDAEISFANYDEMRAFVEEREKNTEWLEQGVRELVFGALLTALAVVLKSFLARCTRNLSAHRFMPIRCTSRRRLSRTRWPEPG